VTLLDDWHGDEGHAGATALVVRELAGLGRRTQERLAIADHGAEDAGVREARLLGDVVGVGRDFL
jgi:hypothetical protein